jgi:hypothetical protein
MPNMDMRMTGLDSDTLIAIKYYLSKIKNLLKLIFLVLLNYFNMLILKINLKK